MCLDLATGGSFLLSGGVFFLQGVLARRRWLAGVLVFFAVLLLFRYDVHDEPMNDNKKMH